MKIKSADAVFSELYNMQYKFNVYNGKPCDEVAQIYKKIIENVPIIQLHNQYLYRARTIDKERDVNVGKGIYLINNRLYGGFNEKESGIAPKEKCAPGRLNRQGEQVLYLAEDRNTTLCEMRAKTGEMISVAQFFSAEPIKVIDFSRYKKEEYEDLFSDEIISFFSKEYGCSVYQTYLNIQKYLTMPDFRKDNYIISNSLIDAFRSMPALGIKYISYYTGKANIALWNLKNEIQFINSGIYRFDEDIIVNKGAQEE